MKFEKLTIKAACQHHKNCGKIWNLTKVFWVSSASRDLPTGDASSMARSHKALRRWLLALLLEWPLRGASKSSSVCRQARNDSNLGGLEDLLLKYAKVKVFFQNWDGLWWIEGKHLGYFWWMWWFPAIYLPIHLIKSLAMPGVVSTLRFSQVEQ